VKKSFLEVVTISIATSITTRITATIAVRIGYPIANPTAIESRIPTTAIIAFDENYQCA
jgi:hypothetical protein